MENIRWLNCVRFYDDAGMPGCVGVAVGDESRIAAAELAQWLCYLRHDCFVNKRGAFVCQHCPAAKCGNEDEHDTPIVLVGIELNLSERN